MAPLFYSTYTSMSAWPEVSINLSHLERQSAPSKSEFSILYVPNAPDTQNAHVLCLDSRDKYEDLILFFFNISVSLAYIHC